MLVIHPNASQQRHILNAMKASYVFRIQYYQAKIESEVTETEFDREGFISDFKKEQQERYPGTLINLNTFEAAADLLDRELLSVQEWSVAFSKGVQITRNNIWLPFLHVLDVEGTYEKRERPPTHLVIKRGHNFDNSEDETETFPVELFWLTD